MATAERSFDEVVGGNVRRLRLAAGKSQDQVARDARSRGLDWTQATVSLLESGDRQIAASEFFMIGLVLHVDLGELVAGSGKVRMTDTATGGLAALQGMLDDSVSVDPVDHIRGDFGAVLKERQRWELDAEQEAERKTARKLGMRPVDVAAVSHKLWGRSLTAERDARVGSDANHATRGHATRQLVAEIAARLEVK